jgi:DNA polymerase-1
MDNRYKHVVIDTDNHAHRYWHGSRGTKSEEGVDGSVEYGVLSGLAKLVRAFRGAQFVLAWDGHPARQLAENPSYKANRLNAYKGRPMDWRARLARLRECLAAVIPTLYDPEDEADSEIARFVHQVDDGRSLIVSSDSDLLMLLTNRVDVLRSGQVADIFTECHFEIRHGFAPSKLAFLRALTGDRGDNVKGLPYFPEKVALSIVDEFDTVDAMYQALSREPLWGFHKSLTTNQHRKLIGGEARVRSNLRILDLQQVPGEPHYIEPTGDTSPLWALAMERGAELVTGELLSELSISNDVAASHLQHSGWIDVAV